MPHLKIRGFTIVELVIVITVIGILAAIVIVSYTGAQMRANDAKRLSVVDAWEEVLKAYDAKKGHFPVVDAGTGDSFNNGDTNRACLGTDLPVDSTFGAGQCVLSTAFAPPGVYWNLFFSQNNALNTELQNTVGALPASRYQMVFVSSIGGDVNHNYKLRGIMYGAERKRVDGGGNPIPESAYIRYALDATSCKAGDYVWESVNQSSGNEKYRLCERNLLNY